MLNSNVAAKPRVLAIDDDSSLGDYLREHLSDQFYVEHVETPRDGLDALYHSVFDCVLLDMNLPELNGIQLLKIIRGRYPNTAVVMFTANDHAETIVEATKAGADNYVVKDTPNLEAEIRFRISQSIEHGRLKGRAQRLETKANQLAQKYEIIGTTAPILKLQTMISALSGTDSSVHIDGETGTGKELVARALNIQEAENVGRPFEAVNCSAIPESLAESEFFGHEKGSFTGATQSKPGKFILANGGDIFLDEIGDLPLSIQAKLLRVIQERMVTPVGGNKPIPVKVRIISATHRDLMQEVRAGRFREDLYYRLNVMSLHVPPLRERKEDIPLLVTHFLKEFSGGNFKLTQEVLQMVQAHPWRGNIRELRNCLERACIFARMNHSQYIGKEEMLLPETRAASEKESSIPEELLAQRMDDLTPEHYRGFLDWSEKTYLKKAYEAAGENKSKLSEKLDLSRDYIHRKFKTLGLTQSNIGVGQC